MQGGSVGLVPNCAQRSGFRRGGIPAQNGKRLVRMGGQDDLIKLIHRTLTADRNTCLTPGNVLNRTSQTDCRPSCPQGGIDPADIFDTATFYCVPLVLICAATGQKGVISKELYQ